MRIIATGVNYTSPEPEDPSQSSLTLDSGVISTGFQNDGRDNFTTPGQGSFSIPPSPSKIERKFISPSVPSRTSSNNWINFCNTVNKPLTNGQQIHGTRAILLTTSGYSVKFSFQIFRRVM